MTKFCIFFFTPPVPFLLSRSNAAKYRNSKKKLVHQGRLLYTCANFDELWPTNPWDLGVGLQFFLKTLCQGRTVRACVHSVGMLCGYMPNSSCFKWCFRFPPHPDCVSVVPREIQKYKLLRIFASSNSSFCQPPINKHAQSLTKVCRAERAGESVLRHGTYDQSMRACEENSKQVQEKYTEKMKQNNVRLAVH